MATDPDFYAAAKFVSDRPADRDEFSNQAHDRLAATLKRIITTNEGGRAVGLEGTWGSGKSTVADLAARSLEKKDRAEGVGYSVFVFDAWAHQGDPLRRVFLEELISKLSRDKAIDPAYWNSELEKLRSKRKKTTEEKAEKLSPVAKVAILTVPFYPLAYALILQYFIPTNGVSKSITLPIVGDLPVWLLGFLIAFTPYLAAFIVWLNWRRWRGPEWYKPRLEKEGKSVVVAFTRQIDHVTTEQYIREDEATTVEFNAKFDELVTHAFDNGFCTVIILDNLDRLAPDQIRLIWGTMRNFFVATPGSARHDALKNVWLVVPIDRRHIEFVFSESHLENGNQDENRGFIEKTFEIVLRIPPPLLSNWEKFLREKLKEAFNELIPNSEIYKIYQFLDLFLASNPITITPRSIKTYVNDIVAQSKLSGNSIPLEYQALYTLYRHRIVRNIGQLQDSTILDESVRLAVSAPDWAMFLAACHFNTTKPEDALELLLAPGIESALAQKEAARLSDLRGTEGFDLILHQVVRRRAREWSAEDPNHFLEIVGLIADIRLPNGAVSEHVWGDFLGAVSAIGKPIEPSERSRLLIRKFIESIPTGLRLRLAEKLVDRLQIISTEAGNDSFSAGELWFGMVDGVAEGLGETGTEDVKSVIGKLNGPIEIEALFGASIAAARSSLLDFSVVKTTAQPADIALRLTEFLQAETIPNDVAIVIESFSLAGPKAVEWKTVLSAINARLQKNAPPLDGGGATTILRSIRTISANNNRASTIIESLIADGTFYALLQIGLEEALDPLIELCLSEILKYRHAELTGPAEHPQYGALAKANAFLKELVSDPEAHNALVDTVASDLKPPEDLSWVLMSALNPSGDHELFRSLARHLISATSPEDIPLDTVWAEFSAIEEMLGAGPASTLLDGFELRQLETDLKGDAWKAIQPSFMRAITSRTSDNARQVEHTIKDGLEATVKDQWIAVLADESNELALLFATIDEGSAPSLQLPFHDALQADTEAILGGRHMPTRWANRWHELPSLLPPAAQQSLFKWLRDQLINRFSTAEAVRKALLLFGRTFVEKADFPDRADDTVRTIVEPLVAAGADENFDVILEHANEFSLAVAAASDDQRGLLNARLAEVQTTLESTKKEKLEAIAAALGISLPLAEPEQDEVSQESSEGETT